MPIRNLDDEPPATVLTAPEPPPAPEPPATPTPPPSRLRSLRTALALSGAGARRALSRLQRAFTEDPGAHADLAAEADGARSLHRAAINLRGGAAKVAQLTAYFEGPDALAGEESRATLEDLFDRLPGSDPEGVRRLFTTDLGRPPEEVFASFDAQPFAAASLGEVHGARDQTGAEYAVKIQYPGVDQALAADLQSATVLHKLTGGAMGRAIPADARDALRAAVLAEVDYRAEADFLQRFRRAFRADRQIVIPKVFPDRSGPRVLTTERLHGQRLPDFLRGGPAEDRATVAVLLFRYGFGGPLVHGLLNADPNPGNYLVLGSGAELRVGFLDYGCCIELPEATQRCDQVMWQALLARDGEGMRFALHREGLIREPIEFDSNRYRAWERCLAEPFQSTDFLWSSDYARSLAELTSALVCGGRFTLPAPALLLWRQRLGLSAVLGQLGARANFRGELLRALREADMAPLGVK